MKKIIYFISIFAFSFLSSQNIKYLRDNELVILGTGSSPILDRMYFLTMKFGTRNFSIEYKFKNSDNLDFLEDIKFKEIYEKLSVARGEDSLSYYMDKLREIEIKYNTFETRKITFKNIENKKFLNLIYTLFNTSISRIKDSKDKISMIVDGSNFNFLLKSKSDTKKFMIYSPNKTNYSLCYFILTSALELYRVRFKDGFLENKTFGY